MGQTYSRSVGDSITSVEVAPLGYERFKKVGLDFRSALSCLPALLLKTKKTGKKREKQTTVAGR